MNDAAAIRIASEPQGQGLGNRQLRKHLPAGAIPWLRWLYQAQRLGRCGNGAHFDKNVKLMRYPRNIFVDQYAVIKEGARLCACNASASLRIGKNTTVGYHAFIFASRDIQIGDDCLLAPFVYIVDSNHGSSREQRINQQGNMTAPVAIGNDVWLGVGARILAGVEVGTGAVVAAGAVVTSSVAPYTVVGGIPAKRIGERK